MSNKYALLVGNAEYNDEKLNLKTPVEDVLALERVLLDGSIGGFDEVRVLTNATLPQMRRAIGELFTQRHKPDDMLLFYFSGHGELDDDSNLYLMARDTERGSALSYTGLDSGFIANLMTRARSRRQVIILDSCYSGAFGRGAKSGTKVGTKSIFEGNGYGRYVLTASDALQLSWEGDRIVEGEITHSFFTHYLLDGLRTGAADRNGDGYVGLDELYDHIYEGMMQASGRQEPLKFTFNEKGDLAIARSPLNAGDRQRQRLTQMLIDAETSLDSGDYRRAEMLLTKVINADPDEISEAAARSLLEEIARERTRAEAYAHVKQLVEQAPRIAKAAWDAFVEEYDSYDPDGLAAVLETPTRRKPTAPKLKPAPKIETPPKTPLPPPFEWIEIPGGSGTMKTDEQGVTLAIPTERYWMAKYPITNGQFAPFIEAGGYRERKWWTDAGWNKRDEKGWTEPRFWSDSKWNGAEQPVVGVSWYEAVAFCHWLSEQTGQKIMLPTEAQWQYAAQSDDGRNYPWGTKWDASRCQNSVDSKAGVTSSVTQYESKGDSPFGVVDMAGNVWEWCLTDYNNHTNDVNSDANRRVLRGGSWNYDGPNVFRCDFRLGDNPDYWYANWGFRVSRS